MNAATRTQRLIWLYRHQPLTVRLLAATAGILTAAAAFAAPAEADPVDDNFIDALNHAHVDFGQPGNAIGVGQSICPMLAKPGGSFAAAASSISHQGMSPGMAQMFTTIAIQMYCPTMLDNLAHGNLSGLPQIPGMPGIPGMGGTPGIGGGPGIGGAPGIGGGQGIPGMPGF
jgi:Protein of unknown function (DUF732)